MVFRVFVEKKAGFDTSSTILKEELNSFLGVKIQDLKIVNRFDTIVLDDKIKAKALSSVIANTATDIVTEKEYNFDSNYKVLALESLPGQFDQTSDSIAIALSILLKADKPPVLGATLYAFKGITDSDFDKIKGYLLNKVEKREASFDIPKSLELKQDKAEKVKEIKGFNKFDNSEIADFHASMNFAMSVDDLKSVQEYFKSEKRNPKITELKILDTYWSDHCRHTTFLTQLNSVKIKSAIPQIEETYNAYKSLFSKHYKNRTDKYECLMDMATMGAREVKARGKLANLDESDEINACSIKVTAKVDGKDEDWIVMFKNETHNHPTEIEPYGGAGTCLGGAIRDPLSGRVYCYQAMRVTGASDITASYNKTLPSKLSQRYLTQTATAGYSAYGNQIGLAAGLVEEIYHQGYTAKRMEAGFVVAAGRAENIVRQKPVAGDVILLIGGRTGRDGLGGATGSSRSHTQESIDSCSAEVQKGNPLQERSIIRLFRKKEATNLIKKCNDFGAGGVSVAIGELSDGLAINLNAVPLKYSGMSATEIAISESQERMAVVIASKNVKKFITLCANEDIEASVVATVTDNNRMTMYYDDEVVADLSRDFLNTNGVRQHTNALIKDASPKYFTSIDKKVKADIIKGDYVNAVKTLLKDLNNASQKGVTSRFDSSSGGNTIIMPYGGKYQLTPAINMAAKLPVLEKDTTTATVCAYGYDPYLSSESPFLGAVYAVLVSVIKVVIAGVKLDTIRLTFQEYFERLFDKEERWGKPVSSVLGSLFVQLGLELGSIGGKDSMSGTYENIDVPPALISFALGIGKSNKLITNVLTKKDQKVYRFSLNRDKNGVPNLAEAKAFLEFFSEEVNRGNVDFASIVESGGAVSTIIKSCLGNGLGFKFKDSDESLFYPLLGDVVFSCDDIGNFIGYDLEYIGTVTENAKFTIGKINLKVSEAEESFSSTFEDVFPLYSKKAVSRARNLDYNFDGKMVKPVQKTKSPKVLLPLFPGTTTEYELVRKFTNLGATVETLIIKQTSLKELTKSYKDLAKAIKECDILVLAGGFSEGTPMFINSMLANPQIVSAVKTLNDKKGLILGINDGFKALLNCGLLPYGKFTKPKATDARLVLNDKGYHVSQMANVRLVSNLSPWYKNADKEKVYTVPVSSLNGKFAYQNSGINRLNKRGQIATQFTDLNGKATLEHRFNPTGSDMAVESITSPDGRILGKIAHEERLGKDTFINIAKDLEEMQIFKSAIEYFK